MSVYYIRIQPLGLFDTCVKRLIYIFERYGNRIYSLFIHVCNRRILKCACMLLCMNMRFSDRFYTLTDGTVLHSQITQYRQTSRIEMRERESENDRGKERMDIGIYFL